MKLLNIFALALIFSSSSFAQEITVSPARISETRSGDIMPPDQTSHTSMDGLTLTLHIAGEGVRTASTYGKIEIAEAVDDTGKNLKPEEGAFYVPDEFQPTVSEFDRMMRENEGKADDNAGFNIELKLLASAREAKTLRTVKGQFQVRAGGEKRTVKATQLLQKIGKPLEDPALKEAGVEISFIDPKTKESMFFGGDDANSLAIRAKGSFDNIADVHVTSAAGEDVTQGNYSSTSNAEKTIVYNLSTPLTDDMTLAVDLLIGQETITVPIDLKDIPLP